MNQLPHFHEAEPMTVGDLKKYIRNLPNDTRIYMLTDKSPGNWDDDKCRWSVVYPLSLCTREYNEDEDGGDELNLLLECEEP